MDDGETAVGGSPGDIVVQRGQDGSNFYKVLWEVEDGVEVRLAEEGEADEKTLDGVTEGEDREVKVVREVRVGHGVMVVREVKEAHVERVGHGVIVVHVVKANDRLNNHDCVEHQHRDELE